MIAKIDMTSLSKRFFSRVKKTKTCWNWTGGKYKEGYGAFYFKGGNHGAHRIWFILTNGLIKKGMQLDHLCRNPSCVNPSHLEIVTPRENVIRGVRPKQFADINGKKTHCPRGHPYSGKNVSHYKTKQGWNRRVCRICANTIHGKKC